MKYLLIVCFLAVANAKGLDWSVKFSEDGISRESRIIRGDDAEPFAYPFQVYFSKLTQNCAGF